MAYNPNGLVIYRGPSLLDGAPIAVVVTGLAGASNNAKTGDMLQTWIIRSDVSPTEAVASGDDASICGDCPHRGHLETTRDGLLKNVGRSCYVTVFQAPLNVFKTMLRGRYADATGEAEIAAAGAGRKVRIGAYGDPAAVPLWVWQAFTSSATGWTGYTHQWRAFPEIAPFCMASADSPADRAAAKLLGFRTFRVRSALEELKPGEIACPASDEAGKRTTCAACGLCKGATAKAKDVAIIVHGSAAKVNAFKAAA